jgi:uncharacterized protein (DUF2164 family)
MRIRLDGERRDRVLRAMQRFFAEQLDRPVSPFQAEQILDFLVLELGAPVYNQAIRDAHAFIQDKLIDLQGEFYEPEEPYRE